MGVNETCPRVDYQKVFESAPALFLILGPTEDFPILDASDAFLRATHTQRDAIIGQPLFLVFPDNPDDPGATGTAHLRSSLTGVLRTGQPDTMAVQRYDIRRPATDGGGFEERYWSLVNTPVLAADGRALYILHRVEDVTGLRSQDLNEANRQLREATEQFQAMYEQGLFAARLRPDGTVIDVNRAAVEICLLDRAHILDRPFWECGWWNRSQAVQTWIRNAVDQAVSGEPFRGESLYFWGDGSEHVVDFACMPIKDHTGRVVAAVATGMDVTERVRAEQNIRALETERRRAEALAEVDRAKTQFFSNVSHEFRTPLTLMLGPVEEALANEATPPSIRIHLERAHRNALRLLKLVNSLLDFSRIEAGRVEMSYEPTELDVMTRDLASTFRSAMEKAGLVFTVQCDSLGEPTYVDREMWEKIVLNLLSNAFKFTLRGGVAVQLRRDGNDAVLEISDTGVGVAEHELPRLFERFYRVEGTAGRTQEGSGIGLALVQELVKLHSGSIVARSELGIGTTFRVSLPLGTDHLAPERIKAHRSLSSTAIIAQSFVDEALRWIPSSNTERLREPMVFIDEPVVNRPVAEDATARILLADDNADMRDYVAGLLSAAYAVEAVADGEQALAAARRERPDLIVADVMMPRLDGLSLLKALRGDPSLRDVPVVLLSARAGEEAHVEGLDAGADDYLVKPFSARELLARIAARLELTRMRRENQERLHALASATSEVIYRMSPDWSEMRFLEGRNFITDTNDPSCSWVDRYLYPEDQPHVLAQIQEAIQSKSVFRLEHRVRRVDGTVGWTYSRAIPLKNADGEITEWFGAAADVTERKATEQALAEADKRKDEFLAMLAHELRNPLAPISHASELLSRSLREDGLAQTAVGVIKRQVVQMTRLVDDLLDVSRITQGRIQLQKQPVELGSVIAQTLEAVEPHLREKQHRLSTTALNYEPLYVSADFARLTQCVGNLLTNAIKYTETGGDISVRTRGTEAAVYIEVSDTGTGIAPELLPRVFDLFVQSERTLDRAQGGLGIGLAVVRRLVEMHGGEVRAQSAGIGQGSTFEIRLPRIARPANAATAAEATETHSKRVLLVDDNIDAADSLSMLLSLQGHVTRVAYSAKEALICAEAFRPEIVLLDIGLPNMNGYELAKALRAVAGFEGIRLIALTGYGQAEDYQRTQAAGFDDHLVKPVDLAKLEHALAVSGITIANRRP